MPQCYSDSGIFQGKDIMNFAKKTHLQIIVILFAAIVKLLFAEPITYYTRLTNIEETILGEYIYYGSSDTLRGITRSNDFIPINGEAVFGPVITSEELMFEDENFEFNDIREHASPFPFPNQLGQVMRNAVRIPTQNNQLMTWINFRGEQGFDVYQYPGGTPRRDSLYQHFQVPNNLVLYVNGDVEVEGSVAGQITVYSSGNMFLIDNIQYLNSDPRNGWFESQGFPHMLGLVSDRNIIIKNNIRNGKESGWNNGGGAPNRHSININGSLIALGGSFTFDHQNDEGDPYQGPAPDERGIVNLKGSLAQFRRGYLHRDNHGGTGYHTNIVPDERLITRAPPGFYHDGLPEISGRHDRLILEEGSFTFSDVVVNTLIVQAGVELLLIGGNALTINDSLIISGSEHDQVTVHTQTPNSRSAFRVARGNQTHVDIRYCNFSDEIDISMVFDSLWAKGCIFERQLTLEGNTSIDSCHFSNRILLTSPGYLNLSHSVLEGGIDINGDIQDGYLINNTIVGAREDGIFLHQNSNIRIANNLIAYNRSGINNRCQGQLDLAYNCVYDNFEANWIDCEQGNGSFSENPRMENFERALYHLSDNSPCIDAGDPSSPLDPDETRADIGAFHFDHEPRSIAETYIPEGFDYSVYPNPFNSSINITISNSLAERAEWLIMNIRGQTLSNGNWNIAKGENEMILPNIINTPGVYFLQIKLNACTKREKLIYIP